ncbi:hypothetical protein FIBSPDRAFT_595438 [Athelia psychrophila]|uniref:Uncharacterized protein n=1 Tax=Athelia psychrophila TaxID=1759441 RepID=A0A166BU36_9AGAM|nr:hypothetical protein FIBSPDRAFT_146872 [Fibularhizoctonia sp. CBS 109695]KZP18390.1 hypothetical protein FIBSPDRAFT_595438 [Fibularhizoctonia sp. CBS 109695]
MPLPYFPLLNPTLTSRFSTPAKVAAGPKLSSTRCVGMPISWATWSPGRRSNFPYYFCSSNLQIQASVDVIVWLRSLNPATPACLACYTQDKMRHFINHQNRNEILTSEGRCTIE